jgi:hypothetical protein
MLSLILQFVFLLRDSEMGGRLAGFVSLFPVPVRRSYAG